MAAAGSEDDGFRGAVQALELRHAQCDAKELSSEL